MGFSYILKNKVHYAADKHRLIRRSPEALMDVINSWDSLGFFNFFLIFPLFGKPHLLLFYCLALIGQLGRLALIIVSLPFFICNK